MGEPCSNSCLACNDRLPQRGDTNAMAAHCCCVSTPALSVISFICHNFALQVVKIDVEGFEPQVYAGGRQFFGQVQPHFIMAEVGTAERGWAMHASSARRVHSVEHSIVLRLCPTKLACS